MSNPGSGLFKGPISGTGNGLPPPQSQFQGVQGSMSQNNMSVGSHSFNSGSNVNNVGIISNNSGNGGISNIGSSSNSSISNGNNSNTMSELYSCVQLLSVVDQKPLALAKLFAISKNSPECASILASILWHSYGTIAILLQEIVNVYPYLSSMTTLINLEVVGQLINRATHAINLLAFVANSGETKHSFLGAYLLVYLYPFVGANERIFEGLCLSSLLVIGSLVKVDRQPTLEQSEMIKYLLETDFFSRCLEVIKNKSDESLRSKMYATYILDKILADNLGNNYVCDNQTIFYIVTNALTTIVVKLVDISNMPPNTVISAETGARILTHILRCYLRLSDSRTNRDQLRVALPDALKTPLLARKFHSADEVTLMIAQINQNLAQPTGTGTNGTSTAPVHAPVSSANYNLGTQTANSNSNSIAIGQNNYANFLSENVAQSGGIVGAGSNGNNLNSGNSYSAAKANSKWLG